jgi:drug/metabolite transporter (DMT)-like permease
VELASRRFAAQASLIWVAVVWAGAFSAIKALLDHGMAAEDVALLRYLVAAPGFAFVLWRTGGLPGLMRGDALRLAAAGVLVVAGYHISLNVGTRFTTSGTAALVVALAPALTLVFAAALGVERVGRRSVAGLATAFAGVGVVVLLGSGGELSLSDAKGPLIVLGAPLAFALYNVLLKPLLHRYDLVALTAAASLFGILALLPLVRASTVEEVTAISASDAALVLYLGAVCTFLGYIAWNVGLRGLGPTRAVSFAYAIPPLAVLIGALTLDEPVTAWLVAGGALIVAGVALAQQDARRTRRAGIAAERKTPTATPDVTAG